MSNPSGSAPIVIPFGEEEQIGKAWVPWPLCSLCLKQLGSGDMVVVSQGLHAHIDCVLERLREVVLD